MTDTLKQKIKEGMSVLPKEQQEVIDTFGWEKISEEVGKKYLFDEEKINLLQAEVAIVILGLTSPEFLVFNIENKVGTITEDAKKITEEINQKIFNPMSIKLIENIKDNLKNRSINWQQNLDFILSGGDYTTFIRRVPPESKSQNTLDGNTNFTPSKIDDLKSKFTI